jgi:outer membrane protein TolC
MTLFKRGLLSILLFTFALSSYASDVLTLSQMRREVLADNIDVKIQYERYYQARQNVQVKLGEFLPTLNVQLFIWNTTFGILNAVTPLPSNWFNYEASKELAIAEKYITDSIKLNILKDLTLTFLSIKEHEEMYAFMQEEEKFLVNANERANQMLALGLINSIDAFESQRSLETHRNRMLAMNIIIAAEKESIALTLGRNPDEPFELGEVDVLEDEIPVSVERAIEVALNNSPEVKANQFMQYAAQYMVQSARWSFISFSGIGFGYPAALRIEKSKLRVIQLEGEKLRNQVANQMNLAYSTLDNFDARISNQQQIVLAANENYLRVKELYDMGQATLQDLTLAYQAYLTEQKELASLNNAREAQIIKIKRLLGLDATQNDISIDDLDSIALTVSVNGASFGRKRVVANIDLPFELRERVVSVIYGGDIFSYRVENINGDFNLMRKLRASGEKEVTAKVILNSGQVVELKEVIAL